MKIEQLFYILSDEEKKEMLAVARKWEQNEMRQQASYYILPVEITSQAQFDDFGLCRNKIALIKATREWFGNNMTLFLAKTIVEQWCEKQRKDNIMKLR